jgi:uncharacterized protein (DUF58 family)
VTERHPELATDIVLLLDAGTSVGAGDDATLRRSVRAAMALAESHLARHDRVGLCSLGGRLHWLPPKVGRPQLHRLVDALLDSQEVRRGSVGTGVAGALAAVGPAPGAAGPLHAPQTTASPGIRPGPGLPLRGLAPGTTVVALSPLLDRRLVEVVAELRQRGFDVMVVEPSAEAAVAAARGTPSGAAERLAGRVWRLEREAVRRRLAAVGIPTLTWHEDVPLAALLTAGNGRQRGRTVARLGPGPAS